jgi:hypothetical protein
MDIETKIANALADFDDLLVQGLTLETSLRIAASENDVSERALAGRASRGTSLEERKLQVIARAKLDRESAMASRAKLSASHQAGYYRKLRSGKKVWIEPSQFKFKF